MGCTNRDFAPTSITTGRGNLFPPTILELSHDSTENTCSVEWIKSQVEEFSDEIGGFVVRFSTTLYSNLEDNVHCSKCLSGTIYPITALPRIILGKGRTLLVAVVECTRKTKRVHP